MSWQYESKFDGYDGWHEGYFVVEFADGRFGWSFDGPVVTLEALEGKPPSARATSEITGWRFRCECHFKDRRSQVWTSDQHWTRVRSSDQHDVNAFRVFALDAMVEDIDLDENVRAAAIALWHREHLDAVIARGEITVLAEAMSGPKEALRESLLSARDAGLDWSFIVAAANMTRQQASALWPNLIDSTDG
jgi:hypothetical protein